MRAFIKDVIIMLALVGVAVAIATCDRPSHNARGGYIDACGELPGMIGDDC